MTDISNAVCASTGSFVWRSVRMVAVAAAAMALFANAVRPAQAQTDRPERSVSRDNAADKSSGKSDDKDFTLGFDLPLRHSSQVTSVSVDSVVDDRPDKHATPELYLKWSHQYQSVKASFEVGASLDRYAKSPDANIDSLHSSFKLAKTDGKWEYFVPYLSLSNDMYFLPTFQQPDIAYYDVAAGFYSGLAWRDKNFIPYMDSLIPYSDASEPGDQSLHFDLRLGRRMSDTTNYQNTFVSGRLTSAYVISNQLRVEGVLGVRMRWYEDYYSEKRRDLRPSASLGLVWTPDWLTKLVKRGELSLNFEFYRNYSNITDKNYSLWEVGPTLTLRTKF